MRGAGSRRQLPGIAVLIAGAMLIGVGAGVFLPSVVGVVAGAVGLAICLVGLTLWRRRARDLEDRLGRHDRYVRLATTDSMTGLLNRHGLDDAAAGLVASAQRLQAPVTVWYVDVDGLKAANDRFGHEAGDALIRAVGDALKASVRVGDLLARVGGDEFVVVGLGTGADPESLARRVQAHVDPEVLARRSGASDARVVSVGSATGIISPVVTLTELTRRADHDMYGRRFQRREGSTAPTPPR